RSAKNRGYVTHDQMNSVLPAEEVNSEQIEDVIAMFSEMGVNVVETEEPGEDGEETREEADEEAESESGELVEVQQKVPAKSEAKEPTERTDDPVRMYLREMGSVELLSREGEIAIAKRIEAGREAMIAGLGESPCRGAPERGHVGNGGEQGEAGEAAPGEGDFDDDDMENSLSLAAIEAELKPKVVETFDNIADAYKRLRRLQDQDIQNKLRN